MATATPPKQRDLREIPFFRGLRKLRRPKDQPIEEIQLPQA